MQLSVSLQHIKCWKWPSFARDNYGVCYATVRSPHTRSCSAGIQSTSQPAAAATWPYL